MDIGWNLGGKRAAWEVPATKPRAPWRLCTRVRRRSRDGEAKRHARVTFMRCVEKKDPGVTRRNATAVRQNYFVRARESCAESSTVASLESGQEAECFARASGNDGVTQATQSVHPSGKPIIHVTNRGERRAFAFPRREREASVIVVPE